MIIIKQQRVSNLQIFKLIENAIWKSMEKSCKTIADMHVILQKQTISEKAKHSTGKLGNSLIVKPSANTKNSIRFDIMATVPYDAWVNWGSSAPFGLPYSKNNLRDYSKTNFPGHDYIQIASDKLLSEKYHFAIIQGYILQELKSL